MISRKGCPSTQEVYRGQTNQVQKLHKSINSRKEENDWFRKADSHSIKKENDCTALVPTGVETFPWKTIWKPKVPISNGPFYLGCFFGENYKSG